MKLVKQELDELGFLITPPLQFQSGKLGLEQKSQKTEATWTDTIRAGPNEKKLSL